MGGENLDRQLEPLAEFLLILMAILFVAVVTAYLLSKYVQRRKQAAHNKVSTSRRDKDTGINLLAKDVDSADSDERPSSRSRSKSKSSKSFHLRTFLNDLSYKLNFSRGRRRSKRGRGKRRRSSSSGDLQIDLSKKPES
jgi:hypothetical protein